MIHETPDARSRYMPKSQAALAKRILEAAWKRHQERQFPDEERKRIGEIVSAELEHRFPAADMNVLERYRTTHIEGAPETRDEYREAEGDGFGHVRVTVETGQLKPINVQVYNPHSGQWEGVGVEPARPVRIAGSGGAWGSFRLRANARAAYRPAPYGVSPENVERHKREGTWDQVCAENEAYFRDLATDSLPPETDAFFQRVMDLRRDYREQYQGFQGWLESFRGGAKPTWADIEARFPFIGEYLAELRQGEAA